LSSESVVVATCFGIAFILSANSPSRSYRRRGVAVVLAVTCVRPTARVNRGAGRSRHTHPIVGPFGPTMAGHTGSREPVRPPTLRRRAGRRRYLAGGKRSHWIFVRADPHEAVFQDVLDQYFPILGPRLVACARALTGLQATDPVEVLGPVDAQQLMSSSVGP
jgi:hypothetical protein